MIAISLILFAELPFLIYSSKKKEGEVFNIRQYFIYEAFSSKKEKMLRVFQAFLILLNVAISICLYFLPSDLTITSNSYFLLIATSEVIIMALFLMLSLLSFRKEKLRVASFMFYGAFIAIRNGTAGFILLSISRKTVENNSLLSLIFAVLCFIFAVMAFIPLLNPKLVNYAKLDQVSEKDGTLSYQRPKYFVMAFSEWLLFFFDESSFAITILFFCLVL